MAKLTIADLQQMKRDGKKIAAAVAYDYQMAQILDKAGADIVTIGDSVGPRFFGQPTPFEVTVDQMILCCVAVTRGVQHAVVSCDMPFGPTQTSVDEALRAAIQLVKEGHADMVKIDGAADCPEAVAGVARAGIPVWAQFGFTPQTTARFGGFEKIPDDARKQMEGEIREQAKVLEQAGASCFDCTNVGNDLIGEIAQMVSIPVLGGFNTGPKADGRVTVSYGLVGYSADINAPSRSGHPHVGKVIYDGMSDWFKAVRDGTAPP
ncbi:MAG TPA: 3-methyl-2-oxobutanoate hydroxymethyltransferase [Chloroflexota bacterium]